MSIKNVNKFLIILFILLFFIFHPCFAYAENYYADIQISVDESGFVNVEGITNHPDLLVKNSELYTFKKQSYWLLNITKKDVFTDYFYVLTLPQGSVVNYINASGFSGIEEKSGSLIITGDGGNEYLSIIVQYQLNKDSLDFNVLLILGILILTLTALLIYLIYQSKRKHIVKSNKKIVDEVEYDFKGLNDRQKQIIKLLIDVKRPLTQSEIQKELGIPKAAVSRNIHSLEIKNLIEIEQIGMSNLIRLKKP